MCELRPLSLAVSLPVGWGQFVVVLRIQGVDVQKAHSGAQLRVGVRYMLALILSKVW